MWPHSITVGVGGKAISVGTDADHVAARLEAWRIEDTGGRLDYVLELDPPPAGDGRGLRPLPGIHHGSQTLARSRDTERLTTAFLRILASHGRPAGDGQFRVALMPVALGGVALLAPTSVIAALVPDRWMVTRGIEPIYGVSSVVDPRTGQVLLDPPLGDEDDGAALVFGGWWLARWNWDTELSPGLAVAAIMQLVSDVTPERANAVLHGVATLVNRALPTFAPAPDEAVTEELKEALRRAIRTVRPLPGGTS